MAKKSKVTLPLRACGKPVFFSVLILTIGYVLLYQIYEDVKGGIDLGSQ